MADKKISALTGASTPLSGTEVLPIVQGGSTVKVAVSDLTLGRSVNVSNLTANGGNLVATTGGYVASDTYYNYGAPLKISAGGSLPIYFQINDVTKAILSTTGGFSIGDATDPGAGNLRMATGNVTVATAAKGINFTANTPAAGMTSQLLNWYEEGTWTPNQGAAVTVVGAFSSSGKYTRVGRVVTITGTMSGATTIAVGAPNIITSNLPFTAADNTPAGITSGVTAGGSALVVGTSTQLYSITAFVASGNSIIFSATYSV